jgi:rhomboid protease GluP
LLKDPAHETKENAMTDDSETIVRIARDEALARDWELVLLSEGLSPRLHHTGDGILLTVPRYEADRALSGLAAYEEENLATARQRAIPTASIDWQAGAVAGLLLLGFFAMTVVWNSAVPWLERGSANAAGILDGELWRTVTALTLHADLVHALSNAFAIVVFFSAVSGQLGAGIGGALILLTGAGGNLANAYLRGPPHDAVGASTAVFGAVGMVGSLAMMRHCEMGNRRGAWVGIAAALALLGMLGSGGARVDVMAHALGFLIGAVMAMLVGLTLPRPPGGGVQWTCGVAAVALIVYCWMLALA